MSYNQRLADLESRCAQLEARLAAVEARPQAVFVTQPMNTAPTIDRQCQYCHLPISQCRGHNICAA